MPLPSKSNGIFRITNNKSYTLTKDEIQIINILWKKEKYTRQVMTEVKDNYFGSCKSSFLKFFTREEKLSEDDVQELLNMINQPNQ